MFELKHKKELKDPQNLIQHALLDKTLAHKIRNRILTPLQAFNFCFDRLMHEQDLFLDDKKCFSRLWLYQESDIR